MSIAKTKHKIDNLSRRLIWTLDDPFIILNNSSQWYVNRSIDMKINILYLLTLKPYIFLCAVSYVKEILDYPRWKD